MFEKKKTTKTRTPTKKTQELTPSPPQKKTSHQLSFWCTKPIKLKQYLTMPSTYGDVPSSTDHTLTDTLYILAVTL